MKRAKDYVAEFEEAGKTEAAAHQILMAMLTEVHELIDKRKAKETAAILAILNEVDDKWRSFVTKAKIPQCQYTFRSLHLRDYTRIYFEWILAFPAHRLPLPTELGLSSQCDLGLHKILNQNPR